MERAALTRHSCTTALNHHAAGHEWRVIWSRPLLGIVHWTQVVLINCASDSLTQPRACHLVGSEVYPAINAGVGDVVRNLLKRGVLQDDVGQRRIRQRDGMPRFAVKTTQDFGATAACAAVV